MKFPKFLTPNGTICFVAPSFGCAYDPEKMLFNNAQRKFKEMGFSIDLGPNCYAHDGIGISTAPEKCGDELTKYYCSDKNDVIISCSGGELMCETMMHVDFEKLKAAEPKWYMGYSDNTNMTFLLATICDTASIYGPCAASFGVLPWNESTNDAFMVLTGQKNTVNGYDSWRRDGVLTKRKLHVFPDGKNEKTGKEVNVHMEGRLLGGCMDCLVNLLGTKFDHVAEFNEKYKEDGIIWFIESCDLNVMAIRRAIWQMLNADWFKYTKGFLVGRPACFGEESMGLDQYHAVVDLLSSFNVPIIMDIDIGHLPPMMPIICGSYGKVDVNGNDISITMETN